jgi:hypothetical protein
MKTLLRAIVWICMVILMLGASWGQPNGTANALDVSGQSATSRDKSIDANTSVSRNPQQRLPHRIIANNLRICRIRIEASPQRDVIGVIACEAAEEQTR